MARLGWFQQRDGIVHHCLNLHHVPNDDISILEEKQRKAKIYQNINLIVIGWVFLVLYMPSSHILSLHSTTNQQTQPSHYIYNIYNRGETIEKNNKESGKDHLQMETKKKTIQANIDGIEATGKGASFELIFEGFVFFKIFLDSAKNF